MAANLPPPPEAALGHAGVTVKGRGLPEVEWIYREKSGAVTLRLGNGLDHSSWTELRIEQDSLRAMLEGGKADAA